MLKFIYYINKNIVANITIYSSKNSVINQKKNFESPLSDSIANISNVPPILMIPKEKTYFSKDKDEVLGKILNKPTNKKISNAMIFVIQKRSVSLFILIFVARR